MGSESAKANRRRLHDPLWRRVFAGKGIDIGSGDDLVTREGLWPDVVSCEAFDAADGDAACITEHRSPSSYDFVYSSHCLEHLPDPGKALRQWGDLVKPGGYLAVVVPDEDLYEQSHWPSRHNAGHQWTFTIHKPAGQSWSPRSLNVVQLSLESLPDFRLLSLRIADSGYDYSLKQVDQTARGAEAAIEFVLQKLVRRPSADARSVEVGLSVATEQDRGQNKPLSANVAQETNMATTFDSAQFLDTGVVSLEPLKIYTGVLGQIGDIIMFTATARRVRELFPNAKITFAVSARYREAGELVAGLPYVDQLFVTELYCEKLTQELFHPWHLGWPVDLRGDDEIAEQRRHQIVLETRPRHRRMPWWKFGHQVAETAHKIGVPGPIDLRTEVAIPPGTAVPPHAAGKLVLHNDPVIDPRKAWPWQAVREFVRMVGADEVVLVGRPGEPVPGAVDLRGQTTLAELAAVIRDSACYIGIDSGPMWIAGSLQVRTVGLYGTEYIPAYEAIQPLNPHASYLQAEGSVRQITAAAVFDAVRRALEPSLNSAATSP